MRFPYSALIAVLVCMLPVSVYARGKSQQENQSIGDIPKIQAPLELHPLVAEARRYLGRGNFTGFNEAWCADAISKWLSSVGLRPLANHMVSSALSYGPNVNNPKPGDLVVLRAHVGIVENINPDGSIGMISGNWGHRVARGIVYRNQVVAFIGL